MIALQFLGMNSTLETSTQSFHLIRVASWERGEGGKVERITQQRSIVEAKTTEGRSTRGTHKDCEEVPPPALALVVGDPPLRLRRSSVIGCISPSIPPPH